MNNIIENRSVIFADSWEGIQGSEIRNAILNALENLENFLSDVANPIVDVDVDWSEDAPNAFTLITKDASGKTISKTIELKTVSTKLMEIDTTGVKLVIAYGLNLSIPYTLEIKDGGIKLPNITAAITVMNNGNTIKTLTSVSTTVGTNKTGTIKIDYSDLTPGDNNILLKFKANTDDLLEKTISLSVNVIDLKLSLSSTLNKLIDNEFSIPYVLSGAPANEGYNTITQVYYFGTPVIKNSNGYVSGQILKFSDISAGSGHNLNGLLQLYLRSAVYDELGNEIAKSNVILIELINGTPSETTVGFIGNVKDIGNRIILVNQYEPTTLQFYGYSDSMNNVNFNLTNSSNSIKKPVNVYSDSLSDLSFTQTFKTIENINLNVSTGNSYQIEILPSTSQVTYPTGQVISLNSIGQSGKEWNYNESYKMTFNNFDWIGNGWKDNYLVFNNGSSCYLNYDPCMLNDYTVSFKYKTSGVTQNETIISNIQGGSGSETGFRIDTNKVVILNNGSDLEYEFDSSTEHEITIVSYNEDYNKLSSIYIDGSIQATIFKNTLSKHNTYLPIEFKADNCNLHLKTINIFNKGLTAEEIGSLYALNIENPTEMFDYINANSVFDSRKTSLYLSDRITINSIPVGAIYMVLESYKKDNESVSLDPTPWKTINGYISNDPDKWKGIRHLLGSVKLIKKTKDGSADPMNFYAERATLSAQGTSSMKYPWKNARIYFKKTIDESCKYYNSEAVTNNGKPGDFGYTAKMFYGVNPDGTGGVEGKATYQLFSRETYTDKTTGASIIRTDDYTSAPAKLFCLKADFAESSGSHNTGFARLMHDLLNNSTPVNYGNEPSQKESNKLPQQIVTEAAGEAAKWKYDIRSTIDGRPIYLFVKEAGKSDSEAIYWGKFNMNNEKSSEDVFGFQGCADYYENQTVKDEISVLERLFGDTQGHLRLQHQKYTIKDGKYTDDVTEVSDANVFYNPNECWEFSNNTFNLRDSVGNYTNIGAFQYPFTPNNQYPLYNQYGGRSPFTAKDSEGELAWLSQAWEYRFPGWETKEGKEDEAHIKYKNGTMAPKLLESLYKWIYKHNVTLYSENNRLSIMDEFARNLNKYFNINYLLKYYIATKWAANTDLRIKNCMLSFYCDPEVLINDDSEYPMGHMRAFYIFYDNDTILGVNNDGALKNPWNVGEEEYPGYNCHGVWEGLNYCYTYYIENKGKDNNQPNIYKLGQLVEKAYQEIRKIDVAGNLRTKYFEEDQVDNYPDMIFNVDAELKYYSPVRNLTLLTGATPVDEPNRVDCINGNRKFHRLNWWDNRTRWFDSKYAAGNNDKYGYSFKINATASGEGLPTGKIKITSALPEWRFYIDSANSQIDNSGLLNVDESYDLNIGSISVSDHVNIISLYGCKELNFNNLTCSSYIGDLSSTGIFPYLRKFTFNDIDSLNVKRLKAAGLTNLVNSSSMPNLQELYLCGVESEKQAKSFELLDLLDCTKLITIDTRNTIINEVRLPNSSQLLKVYLHCPTTLNVSNKFNASVFEIIDSSKVTNITIGLNNNSVVNSKLLSIIRDNMDTEGFNDSKNNILGTEDDLYNIDAELELPILVEIAQKIVDGNNKVMFNGGIVNEAITPEQQELFDAAFGDNLLVSTDDNKPLGITCNKSELLEGEEITFFSTKYLNSVDDWQIAYEGNEGSNTVSYEEVRTRTSLKIKAPQIDDNTGRTHTLIVSLNGVNPVRIPIRYVSVTGLSLSMSNNLLDVNKYSPLTLKYLPEDTTKKHWVESRLEWSENTHGHVSNFNYQLDQAEDDKLQAVVNSTIKSNIILILYDRQLATHDSGKFNDSTGSNKSADSLNWISLLIAKYKGQTDLDSIQTLRISSLRSLQIDSTWISKLGTSTDIVYDFEWMKYVTYVNSDTFVIPSTQFTNFGVPEVDKVTWELNASDYTGYKTIEFDSSLKSAWLSITASQILTGNTNDTTGFNLDFSKCDNIKKLYNKGKNLEEGTISLNVTYPIASNSSVTTLISKYPNNIEQIGNYQEVENIGEPLTMFNGTIDGNPLTATSNAMNGYYKINLTPFADNYVKVGAIYSYNIANGNNVLEMSYPHMIVGTYYTFLNMNLLPANDTAYDFNNILYIGQHTFGSNVSYSKNTIVKLINPTFIGSNAFKFYSGVLKTSSKDFELDLSTVTKVNPEAFIFVKNNLDVTFDSTNLISIGKDVFRNQEDSEVSHKIRIIGDGEFVYDVTSFGLNKTNSLYLSNEVYDWMKNTTNFESLKNNVNVYVNNNLINA